MDRIYAAKIRYIINGRFIFLLILTSKNLKEKFFKKNCHVKQKF